MGLADNEVDPELEYHSGSTGKLLGQLQQQSEIVDTELSSRLDALGLSLQDTRDHIPSAWVEIHNCLIVGSSHPPLVAVARLGCQGVSWRPRT